MICFRYSKKSAKVNSRLKTDILAVTAVNVLRINR